MPILLNELDLSAPPKGDSGERCADVFGDDLLDVTCGVRIAESTANRYGTRSIVKTFRVVGQIDAGRYPVDCRAAYP
jgi:hypothetical protein